MQSLSIDLLREYIFPFMQLRERWNIIQLVCREWNYESHISVIREKKLDLTWCSDYLDKAVDKLVNSIYKYNTFFKQNSRNNIKLQLNTNEIVLYGNRVCPTLLKKLFSVIENYKIKSLIIKSKTIDSEGFFYIKNFYGLKSLSLSCIKLNDYVLLQMTQFLFQLTELDLSGCTKITDEGILAIVNNKWNLKYLNISQCHRITNDSIRKISTILKTLIYLNTSRCYKLNDEVLGLFIKNNNNIKYLNISSCPLASVLTAKSISNLIAPEEIILRNCKLVNEVFISELTLWNDNYKNLECLDLYGSTTTFYYFANTSALPNIKYLNLGLLKSLTNFDFYSIACKCYDFVNIKNLCLEGCSGITDDTLEFIAKKMFNIEILSLCFCYQITEIGFNHLIKNIRKLNDIDIGFCTNIGLESFLLLCDERKQNELKRLVINGLADIRLTRFYANIIRQKHPKCNIILI